MKSDDLTPEIVDMIEDALKYAAAFDQRTVGKADILAWSMACGHLSREEITDAIVGHYSESRDRIMPVDVIRRVRAVHKARLEHTPVEAPDTGAAGPYKDELQRRIRQIANARSMDTAIGPVEVKDRKFLKDGVRAPLELTAAPDAIQSPHVRTEYEKARAAVGPARAPQAQSEDREYDHARAVLGTFEDRGQSWLALAADRLGTDAEARALVVLAAELAIEHERKAAS